MKKLFLLLALAIMLIGCGEISGCLLTITVEETIQNYDLSLDGEPFASGDTRDVESGNHIIRIDIFDYIGDYVDSINSSYYVKPFVRKVDLTYGAMPKEEE